ncbi:MAG: DUF4397 domain-containing protein [Pleurocapsa sp. SU_196_0]|nr:DUF4397 domain-containing protein [Pleurocapsa sp. SU_196_0]
MKQVILGGATLVLALAACNMTPAQKVQLRVAHLSPDAPAVACASKPRAKPISPGSPRP